MDAAIAHLISAATGDLDRLTRRMLRGEMSPAAWQDQALAWLATYHAAAYLLGREVDQIDLEATDLLTATLDGQAGYLDRFRRQVETGKQTPAQARARIALYGAALYATWSRGRTWDWSLPFQPRDGATACGMRCKCQWQARSRDESTGDGEWIWLLGATDEHCRDCRRRADGNPYRFIRGVLQ